MDTLITITDLNDVISAIDECQLNITNLGHEWWFLYRACDCQALLDATGDSMTGDKKTVRTLQPLRRVCIRVCERAGMRACGDGVSACVLPSQLWCLSFITPALDPPL